MGIEKRRHKRVLKRVTVRYGEHDFSRSGITNDVSASGAFIIAQYFPPIGARVHLQLVVGQNTSIFLEGEVKRHRVVQPHMRQIDKGGFGVRFLTPVELIAEVAPQLKAAGVAAPSVVAEAAAQPAAAAGTLSSPSAAFSAPVTPSARPTPTSPAMAVAEPPVVTSPVPASSPSRVAAAAPPVANVNVQEHRFEVSFADAAQLKHTWDREIRFGGLYVKTDLQLARETPVVVRIKLEFVGQEFTFGAKVVQTLSGTFKGLALSFSNRAVVERALLSFVGTY